MSTAQREDRTIRHALFTYENDQGGEALAFRGATVALLPADIARGDLHGAFTAAAGEDPTDVAGTLPAFPTEGESAEAEQDRWVKDGKVDEIMEAATADPSVAAAIIEAETRRGDKARKSLLEGLAPIAASYTPPAE